MNDDTMRYLWHVRQMAGRILGLSRHVGARVFLPLLVVLLSFLNVPTVSAASFATPAEVFSGSVVGSSLTYVSMAHDSSGNPYAAWLSSPGDAASANRQVRVAKRIGGTWSQVTPVL